MNGDVSSDQFQTKYKARHILFSTLSRRLITGLSVILLSGVLVAVVHLRVTRALPASFQNTVVWSGFNVPTTVRFAPDGRVFVAEKSGIIKVFDNIQDTTPTVFADLRDEVGDFDDRGLNSIAIDPGFPTRPYVYAFYGTDGPPGQTYPQYNDSCISEDNCYATGKLVRFTAVGNVGTNRQTILETPWCEVSPHHSAGDLQWGSDGSLYVAHGDGGTANYVDWGQVNFCSGDPLREGGAMRSQDLLTPGDPTSFDGTIIRINPDTGQAWPGNPLAGGSVTDDDPIIAIGLRNPFRFTIDHENGDRLWIGDVGWNTWEEINTIPNPNASPIKNFGWPCYEGIDPQPGYQAANLAPCQTLYNSNSASAPFYQFVHRPGGDAISGIALYRGNNFPAAYNGALFFADYAQGWIKVMMPGVDGLPNPSTVTDFVASDAAAVDLQVGPDGALYYADIFVGTINRIAYFASNSPPIARITASTLSGPLPLTVTFDGTSSSDPNPGDTLSFSWDLNGDGVYGDSTSSIATYTYTTQGAVVVGLKVTDSQGASNTKTVTIVAGVSPPIATIDSPLSTTLFQANQAITFSGHAIDPDTGAQLPTANLSWQVLLHHCSVSNPSDCHVHFMQNFNGVATGSVQGPDHEYPCFVEFILTATKPASGLIPALTGTASVSVQPQITTWSFNSQPSGLQLIVYGSPTVTPFSRSIVVGATTNITAASPQVLGGTSYQFSSWSDGGAQTHSVTSSASPQSFTATFTGSVAPSVWNSWDVFTQAGSPQATVTSNTGIVSQVELYESTNNTGITKGSLFSTFNTGVHPEDFNHVQAYWAKSAGIAYPYGGKSDVGRGSDAGETNAPSPLGVNDLTLHPPQNNHNVVAAFKVPQNGNYLVSNLGVRRVDQQGDSVRYRLYNAQGTQLALLTAINNNLWVTSPTTYTLNNLVAGQYIYFAVDRNGDYSFDATEVSWTVTKNLPVNPPPAPTCTLSANPQSITSGSSSTLSWTTTNADSFSINQGIGAVTPVASGSRTVSPTISTTYTGTVTNTTGSATCGATVSVVAPPPPVISSFTATPSSIVAGNSSLLQWSVTGATSLSINNGVGAVTGTSVSVTPAVTTTYTLTATNAGGSVTMNTTVTVTPSPGPTLTFSAAPQTIDPGGTSILSWNSTNTTSCTASNGWTGSKPVSGSQNVTPAVTTTYALTCTGPGGSVSQQTTVTVNTAPSNGAIWNSWDVTTQAGSPQAVVIANTGLAATIELYESTNNTGVTKGLLFSTFNAGVHPESFNNVRAYWANGSGVIYPYAGKSTVGRGADIGETNAKAPLGVSDLMLHPPSNSHNTVAAFKVPQNGNYTISNLGVRRVSTEGDTVRYHVYNAQGTQLALLTATNNQLWVTSTTTYTLNNLVAGQYIYFTIDRNGEYSFDASEISWTVTKN